MERLTAARVFLFFSFRHTSAKPHLSIGSIRSRGSMRADGIEVEEAIESYRLHRLLERMHNLQFSGVFLASSIHLLAVWPIFAQIHGTENYKTDTNKLHGSGKL